MRKTLPNKNVPFQHHCRGLIFGGFFVNRCPFKALSKQINEDKMTGEFVPK